VPPQSVVENRHTGSRRPGTSDIRSEQELVEEAGVEAVARATGSTTVTGTAGALNRWPSRTATAPLAPILTTTVGTFCASCESAVSKSSARAIFFASRSFAADVHVRQDLFDALPSVVGIVVSVERSGKSGGLHPPKRSGTCGKQLSLQKQRRHMKCGRGQILKVEILKTQLGDGAGYVRIWR